RTPRGARAGETVPPQRGRPTVVGVVLLDLDERRGPHRGDDAREGNDRGPRRRCLLPRPRRRRRPWSHAAHRWARVVVLPPARGDRSVGGWRAARGQPRIGSTLGGSSPGG